METQKLRNGVSQHEGFRPCRAEAQGGMYARTLSSGRSAEQQQVGHRHPPAPA